MATVEGFPLFEVQFTKQGALHDEAEARALLDGLGAARASDLLVLAHGWNNDLREARALYRTLLGRLRAGVDADRPEGIGARRLAVLGVLWPSKRFAEADLIPSGAASGGPVSDLAVQAQLEDLKGVFTAEGADERLEQAKALVPKLEDSASVQAEFADLVRGLLPRAEADDEDASAQLFRLPPGTVMDRLSTPVLPTGQPPPAGAGGAAGTSATGEAAGIGQVFSGMRSAARNLLNFATYYQMKERAGTVGREGVHPLLTRVRDRHPQLRFHLAGHSFGGRLVTAATAGPPNAAPLHVASLTLLQAAFSHYAFAQQYEAGRDGLFRGVLSGGLVAGPILVTHTRNDRAVGLAYPLASKIAGQVAAALGDEHDRYGGIGSNGAQRTPEAVSAALLDTGDVYRFTPGRVHNLRADAFVRSHSDVTNPQVAHALLSAVAAG